MNSTRHQSQAHWIGLLVVLSAGMAHGHDPFDVWVTARVRRDALELGFTMARPTSMLACKNEQGGPATFEPADFEKVRTLLKERAPGLYEISAGDEVLVARAVYVTLSAENDVELSLDYPPPAKGPLRLHAALLSWMPTGYGSTLSVVDEANRTLGWELLTGENDTLEVALAQGSIAPAAVPSMSPNPAASVATQPASPGLSVPAESRAASSSAKMPTSTSYSPGAALVVVASVVVLGMTWLLRRKFSS